MLSPVSAGGLVRAAHLVAVLGNQAFDEGARLCTVCPGTLAVCVCFSPVGSTNQALASQAMGFLGSVPQRITWELALSMQVKLTRQLAWRPFRVGESDVEIYR